MPADNPQQVPLVEERGRYGQAARLAIPVQADALQTVDYWLITAPAYHPAWSQYALTCVRLDAEAKGFPPPVLQFPGATHELLVVALDPESGPYSQESVAACWAAGRRVPFLRPITIAQQHTATDVEMRQICRLASRAVVNGVLSPEVIHSVEALRRQWLGSVTKTLAHLRGEEHSR